MLPKNKKKPGRIGVQAGFLKSTAAYLPLAASATGKRDSLFAKQNYENYPIIETNETNKITFMVHMGNSIVSFDIPPTHRPSGKPAARFDGHAKNHP